jgi:diguanylate cyclase (GGDEF)-like protein/PAS domain S-box-containing protein
MVYTPFIWLPLVSAVVNGSLAWFARQYQDVPSVRPFRFMMWTATVWALLYGLGISFITFPVKLFIVNVTYIPSLLSTLAALSLTLEYTGRGHWLTRERLGLLLAISAIFLGFAFTSEYHQLWRYDYQLHWSGAVQVLVASKGPVYWLYIAYMLGVSAATFTILVTSFRYRTLYFRNTLILTVGMLIPVVTGALYVFGLLPVRGFDWIPTSFTWTGLLYFLAILRARLFDVVPLARNTLVENIDDLVIVLNKRGLILDYNRAAQAALGLSLTSIGAAPTTLSQPWVGIFQRHAETFSCKEELSLELNRSRRTYELTISPIQGKNLQGLGRLFLLHDITKRKQAEADERQQRILAEALRDTAAALNSTLDFDSVLEKILMHVGRVVPTDAANIALLDDHGDLHYVRFYGYEKHAISEADFKKLSFSLDSSSIFMKVYQSGSPYIIPDTRASPDWVITPRGGWIRSYAVMPLRIREKVVGFLNLDSAVVGLYTLEHVHNLRTFADQVAIAVENARLFATVEREIIERRQAEEKLRQLSQAVEQSPVSIMITDTTGKIEYVNPRFTLVTGYSSEEVIGQKPSLLKTDLTPLETHRQLWETISSGGEWRGEFANRKKNGELYYESATISPIFDTLGAITHYIAVKEDITERKIAEEKIRLLQEELREQAIRDPLTGLYNRRYLDEILERELARASRENLPVSFVMIDIDHFKDVNDRYGHGAGDSVLRSLAKQIISQTRVGDIVCRYGGEEFLAVLPGVSAEIAFQVTERWRKLFLGSTILLDHENAKATISCGISEFPTHGDTADELIFTADQAMYRAKAAGRNRVIIWQDVSNAL